MMLYTENPKDITRKLVDLVNESGKLAGYKINTQKSVVFLDTKMKHQQEIKKTIPFVISVKRIKYLGIQLLEEAKIPIFQKLYNTVIKEIEDDTNRWKDMPCS